MTTHPAISRLPAEEEAICLRVREVRLDKQLTQTQFAKQLKLSRERIASYEYARAPIRWGLGDRICRVFLISHRWLAEGSGPKQALYRFTTRPEAEGLFSAGYTSVAEKVSEDLSAAADYYGLPAEVLEKAAIAAPPANPGEHEEALRAILPTLIAHELQFVPGPRLVEYVKTIQKASDRFTADVKTVLPKPAKKPKAK